MKMPNGGYNKAFNVQFATDTKTRIIVGVDVTNNGTDSKEMLKMVKKVNGNYVKSPSEWLVDGGFVNSIDLEEVEEKWGIKVYMPPKKSKKVADPCIPLPSDSPIVQSWKKRMGTEEGKEIYKLRGSTAEYSNARARNCGFTQFLVRGLAKAKSVACLFAIAHNIVRAISLT